MMNFGDFTVLVKNALADYLPEEYNNARISIETCAKNNGAKLTGVAVKKQGDDIAAVHYLEGYYEDYQETENFERVMQKLTAMITKHGNPVLPGKDEIMDYNAMRGRIIPRLINKERNADLLETVAYTDYADLAIIYYLHLDECSAMMVTKQIVDVWNVSVGQIHDDAISNISASTDIKMVAMPPCMLILTNEKILYGANIVLNKNVMKRLSDRMGGEFILIPSSIHEWIAVGVPDGVSAAEYANDFTEMIRDVNMHDVQDVDVLGDHAYRYDAEKNTIVAL